MVKKSYKIMAAVSVILISLVASVSAQNPTRTKEVRIDFDFYAGNKLMPAGNYVVRLLENGSTQKSILVQQQDGNSQAIITSVPNRNKADYQPGVILFHKYGTRYFLAGVQLGDAAILHTAIKSRAEREILKGLAKNGVNTPQDVVKAVTDR
ncbi:MAG: hypothetical protein J2P41_01140 [Blastocatellia bacterium]|nr:hypothetical protein [Blastocatellia bacterium]